MSRINKRRKNKARNDAQRRKSANAKPAVEKNDKHIYLRRNKLSRAKQLKREYPRSLERETLRGEAA